MSWDFKKLQAERGNGKIVVFTNGCFDILHRGHLSYLNEAKQLGDILVVGVDSDQSVKKLKGLSRPINNEQDRKFQLENLKAVDFVYIFDDGNPLPLIEKVRPNFLVKGGDWSPDKIIGSQFVASYGGKVLSLPFISGHSTSEIIKKIQGG